jgi:hypothetical protein
MSNIVVFASGDVGEAAPGFLNNEKRLLSFSLPVDTVKKNLREFLGALDEMLPTVDQGQRGYGLDSFTVAVSINGKGQVGFLGTGGELGGAATLTLSFKRGEGTAGRKATS